MLIAMEGPQVLSREEKDELLQGIRFLPKCHGTCTCTIHFAKKLTVPPHLACSATSQGQCHYFLDWVSPAVWC